MTTAWATVIRWATVHRRTGHYLQRIPKRRWVRAATQATLDRRRSDWVPERDEKRVKMRLTVSIYR